MIGVAMAAGILAGFAKRGSLASLSAVQISWTPVLLISLAVGMIPFLFDIESAPRQAFQLSSHAGILAFMLANIEVAKGPARVGFIAIASGWFLNFLCIALNGGMPLSLWAWREAGGTGPVTPGRGGFFKGSIADASTKLRPIGDVIPVRLVQQVISIGDILILLGIAVVIYGGMTQARVRKHAATHAS
jgi:hypothetical protein